VNKVVQASKGKRTVSDQEDSDCGLYGLRQGLGKNLVVP